MRLHLVALVSTITMTRGVPSRGCFAEDVPSSSGMHYVSRFVVVCHGLHNYARYQCTARASVWNENYTANNWSRGRWIELVPPKRRIETNDY